MREDVQDTKKKSIRPAKEAIALEFIRLIISKNTYLS